MKVEVILFWGGFWWVFLFLFGCCLFGLVFCGGIFLNKFGLMPASLEIQQGRVETGLRIARPLSSLKGSVDGHFFW